MQIDNSIDGACEGKWFNEKEPTVITVSYLEALH